MTLGTGGSGGREGPIAQIGAGFGSLLGNLLRLRPAERRVLMAAGMGAGIGAIFRAPLAGTIFAAEVLYGSPGVRARGHHSRRDRQRHFLLHLRGLLRLGAAVHHSRSHVQQSLAAWGRTCCWPCSWSCWRCSTRGPSTAASGSSTGCPSPAFPAGHRRLPDRAGGRLLVRPACACQLCLPCGRGTQQVLAVLAFGYSAIQDAMTQDTNVAAVILLMIALGKILTTGLTIGSGGSGGVFGPSMVIGGCGGGALGIVLHHLWPVAGAPSGQLRHRGHGRLLRRRRQDALLDADHRQRDDRRLQPAAALAVGLHLVLHPFRQAIDLCLAGRKPVALAGPSRQLTCGRSWPRCA